MELYKEVDKARGKIRKGNAQCYGNDFNDRVYGSHPRLHRQIAFSEEVIRYNKNHSSYMGTENCGKLHSNAWSEEELKLPRYMRSTASSRQRLKENMESGAGKRCNPKVYHRKTVPVLSSSKGCDQNGLHQVTPLSMNRGKKNLKQMYVYDDGIPTIPPKLEPKTGTTCVAIKKRMSL